MLINFNTTVAGTATVVLASDSSIDSEMHYSGDADNDATYDGTTVTVADGNDLSGLNI